ncbi:uncharacterized protein LOC144170944 [Haemaphysalis longicornis]
MLPQDDVVSGILSLVLLLSLERTTLFIRGGIFLLGACSYRWLKLILSLSACCFLSSVIVSSAVSTALFASVSHRLLAGVREGILSGLKARALARADFYRRRGSDNRADIIVQAIENPVAAAVDLDEGHAVHEDSRGQAFIKWTPRTKKEALRRRLASLEDSQLDEKDFFRMICLDKRAGRPRSSSLAGSLTGRGPATISEQEYRKIAIAYHSDLFTNIDPALLSTFEIIDEIHRRISQRLR